mmetsp:Transcript_11511/g.48312  ORF Transcript_11511/g.48312 Transcript_11511/m.48312 type:complete len:292 (-) Transcript_11511:4030-4905(-)
MSRRTTERKRMTMAPWARDMARVNASAVATSFPEMLPVRMCSNACAKRRAQLPLTSRSLLYCCMSSAAIRSVSMSLLESFPTASATAAAAAASVCTSSVAQACRNEHTAAVALGPAARDQRMRIWYRRWGSSARRAIAWMARSASIATPSCTPCNSFVCTWIAEAVRARSVEGAFESFCACCVGAALQHRARFLAAILAAPCAHRVLVVSRCSAISTSPLVIAFASISHAKANALAPSCDSSFSVEPSHKPGSFAITPATRDARASASRGDTDSDGTIFLSRVLRAEKVLT